MRARYVQIALTVLLLTLTSLALAHRSPPPRVPPIVTGGMQLVARYRITSRSCTAFVEALPAGAPVPRADTIDDPHNHASLWRAEIFRVPISAPLEQDAQWVFIRSMRLDGILLSIENERGARFVLDLTSHRVRRAL